MSEISWSDLDTLNERIDDVEWENSALYKTIQTLQKQVADLSAKVSELDSRTFGSAVIGGPKIQQQFKFDE